MRILARNGERQELSAVLCLQKDTFVVVDIYKFSIFMEKKHFESKEQSHVCKWRFTRHTQNTVTGLWSQRLLLLPSVISQRFSGEHVGHWRLLPIAGTAGIGLCEECILWEEFTCCSFIQNLSDFLGIGIEVLYLNTPPPPPTPSRRPPWLSVNRRPDGLVHGMLQVPYLYPVYR